MLRYFRKIWVRHTDGSAPSTAVNCCDLVRVFVTSAAYANMKNMGSGLSLILLTWRIWRAPNNASKWQMGFNSAFKVFIRDIEMVLNNIKIILVYWCYCTAIL